ncbi:MAG: 50S ribosome-binding GTPase, partial [Firmicutes bacterium]|nr:50S ribosome-binding GTPase [Bacillota bacterium]
MPANLTPQYIEAEEAFKRAATTEEKILALEEMLRTIPKHKGTEKMQADIKRRLSRLREEGEAARRKGKGDPFRVEREGAGQVFTVGLPNSGKSALVGALTKAKVLVAPYPFSTQLPIPGMMPYEDVLIQLVDSPPISPDLAPPALLASIRLGDGLLISLDVSVDSCLEDLDALIGILEDRRVLPDKTSRTLLALTKVDLDHARENAEVVRATFPQFSSVEVSTKTGEGLDLIPPAVFRML